MKNLFLILLFILNSNLFSQTTITSSNNPVPGNTMMSVNCDTAGISQGNSGASQNWNFASIVRRDSSVLNWVASSSTPYSSQFLSSNIASTSDNTNYQYFSTSSSNLLTNGNAGPSLVVQNSDPQTVMQYPFTYNSSFSDNFSGSFTSTGVTVYRTGTTTVTGDAWGTISLPSGSYSNALRVRYNITTRDSSFVGVSIVIVTNVTSYLWFIPNRKFPVFEIVYTTSTFNGTPQASSKNVLYNPSNPTIGITQLNSSIPERFSLSQNYPNPFNPSTKIRFEIAPTEQSISKNIKLKIYNGIGKEVATLVNENLPPGSYEADWNAFDIPSGVYYYKLETQNFTETRSMILLK